MAHNDKTHKLNIVIDELTEAQAIALEEMLYQFVSLGSMGSSRWVGFYADGDGNFQPQITVNGSKPKHSELCPKEEIWRTDECRIDFDPIAWKLRGDS